MLLRIDFGNPTLSVSCCLMGPGRKGRGDGVDGPSPVTAGGGGGERVQCNFFISNFPVPVSSWAKNIDLCRKDFHDIAHSQKRNSIVALVYQKY